MSGSIKIEPYCRQCDFTVWLKKIEMVMNISRIGADDRSQYLLTNLDITIFEAVLSGVRNINNYDEVVSFLEKRYSTKDKFLNRLGFFNAKLSGSFDEFATSLQTAFENFDGNKLKEQILVSKFMSCMPQSLSTELKVRRPDNLNACVQICNSLQSSRLDDLSTNAIAAIGQPKNTYSNKNKFNKFNKGGSDTQKLLCYRCNSGEHLASDENCPARDKLCSICRKRGHFSAVCFKKNGKDNFSNRPSPKSTNMITSQPNDNKIHVS